MLGLHFTAIESAKDTRYVYSPCFNSEPQKGKERKNHIGKMHRRMSILPVNCNLIWIVSFVVIRFRVGIIVIVISGRRLMQC